MGMRETIAAALAFMSIGSASAQTQDNNPPAPPAHSAEDREALNALFACVRANVEARKQGEPEVDCSVEHPETEGDAPEMS